MTQVPGDNLEAGVRVEARECVQDTKVRYHHHNLVTHVSDDDEEGVRRRKGEKDEDEDDDTDKKDKKSKTAKDPLKWFGVLSPPSLRQSQVTHFSKNFYPFECDLTLGQFQVCC